MNLWLLLVLPIVVIIGVGAGSIYLVVRDARARHHRELVARIRANVRAARRDARHG